MNDPLLSSPFDYNSPFMGNTSQQQGAESIATMERNLQEAQERYNASRQQRSPMMQRFPQPTTTPVWDEISRIQDSLSSNQLQMLESIPEYAESFNSITSILNREYMRIMRPVVEATADGKQALQHHLEVLKRLVKQAKDDADRQAMLMNDYTQHYSHLTFDQYMQMLKQQSQQSQPNSQSKKK